MEKVKQLFVKLKKMNYRHYIGILITIAFILISVFCFTNAYIRLAESLRDIWYSIKYYFCVLFNIKADVVVSVNAYSKVPFAPFWGMPETWEEFVILWKEYWQLIITKSNINAYMDYIGNGLYNFSRILLLIGVPLFLIFYMLLQRYFTKHNNDYNKDSKPLIIYKKLSSKIFTPIYNWVRTIIIFLSQNYYFKIWFWIWMFNFNAIIIILEFIAYYFYLVVSFDFSTLYRQFYKLICDLSHPLAFIPIWCWFIIGFIVIKHIRENIGYSRLEHHEHKNCGVIKERSISSLIVGSMGMGKTVLQTDMSLSQENIFRDELYKIIVDVDFKFPNFPFINLENAIKKEVKKHNIYNLATCKAYIKKCFDKWNKRKTNNNIFGYDFKKYGLCITDNLKLIYIWDCLQEYTQAYYLYSLQTPLLLSNYSIREDNIFEDLGNFPIWDKDFFSRDARYLEETSKHSHILDFDSLRLGKLVVPNNINKDSLDAGIICITEGGKERGNQLENKGLKKTDDNANQLNDGFNTSIKMCRHKATIQNYPFIKYFMDEQRFQSLGADARELGEIIYIEEKSDKKLSMPFFNIAELLHELIFKKFTKLYLKYRHIRADNTLLMYFLKNVVAKFHNYYTKTYNLFGYHTLKLNIEKGTQDGVMLERKYYIQYKKAYSNRYSTDCFSDFFMLKSLESPVGLQDIPEYETEKASFEELLQQNSYFINDLMHLTNNTNYKKKR